MKINFKSCLKTIVFVLIFGFIGYYVLPTLFSPSGSDTTSTLESTTTIPRNETTSLPTSVPVSNTSSALIVTTPLATIVSTPLEPNIDSTELISKEYKFEYDNFEWTWDIQIPKSLYDYYKALPRSQTQNYSVYVTHPLADEYIQALSEKISQAASDNNYDSFQTISLAAAFVQSLPYTSDLVSTGYDEYPRYPIETLVDNGGDCEDTAILAADLIRHLGYDAVLIIFSGTPQSPGHCAVGVKGDDSINGSYYNYNNNKYYYLETTGSGWELGEMPDDYQGVKANIYPMIPVPILSHNWTTKVKGSTLELKVTIQNLGSAMAKNVYVYAGFDAGNNQCWNHQESPLFNLDVDGTMIATLYLTPPSDKYTRLLVQTVYDGYAVYESYSDWYQTN